MAQFFYPCIDVEASGKNINRIRIEKKVKVTYIQETLGLSAPQAIYKWLSGKGLPSTDHLLVLSHMFDVPIEKLLVYRLIEIDHSPREMTRGVFLSPFYYSTAGCMFFLPGFAKMAAEDEKHERKNDSDDSPDFRLPWPAGLPGAVRDIPEAAGSPECFGHL